MYAVILLALLGTTIMADPLPYYGARIVGGSDTTVERYPFITNMQRLYWGSFWSQACGGSLITSRTIVSAAHCYHGDLPHQWRVLVGTSLASSGGDEHNIEAFIIHEQYERPGSLNNDVAIARLAAAVTYSATVQPVRLAGPHYDLPDDTVLTVIGWGTLESGGSSPEQLQHVDLHHINQQICAERYAYLKTQEGFLLWPDITDAMLCAGIQDVGGKDACQGDSGGPLVHNGNVLVGVVSWGYACADAYFPGVNARVSTLSAWITKHGAS